MRGHICLPQGKLSCVFAKYLPTYAHKHTHISATHTSYTRHLSVHLRRAFCVQRTRTHVSPRGFGSHIIVFTELRHSASWKTPALFHTSQSMFPCCVPSLVITWSCSLQCESEWVCEGLRSPVCEHVIDFLKTGLHSLSYYKEQLHVIRRPGTLHRKMNGGLDGYCNLS